MLLASRSDETTSSPLVSLSIKEGPSPHVHGMTSLSLTEAPLYQRPPTNVGWPVSGSCWTDRQQDPPDIEVLVSEKARHSGSALEPRSGKMVYYRVQGEGQPSQVIPISTGQALEDVQYAEGFAWGLAGQTIRCIRPRERKTKPFNLYMGQARSELTFDVLSGVVLHNARKLGAQKILGGPKRTMTIMWYC